MLRAVVQRRLVSAARGPRVTRRALAEDAKTKAESKTESKAEEDRAGEGASNDATGSEGASSEGAASEPLSARLSALLTTKTAALRSDFDGVDGADEIEAALGAVGDAAAEVAALERNLAASREDAATGASQPGLVGIGKLWPTPA